MKIMIRLCLSVYLSITINFEIYFIKMNFTKFHEANDESRHKYMWPI